MEFKEFQDYCKEHITDVLPEEYKSAKITVNEVTKNNGRVLTSLTVLPDGQNVAPNVYLDEFYRDYNAGRKIEDILNEMAEICVKHISPVPEFENIAEDFKNFDFVKDKVIMTAVNSKKNENLLDDVPHTNREDLSLIYKVYVNSEKDGVATITIHNNHLDFWGVTVDELHDLAMKNTRELLPVTVQTMGEVMRELFANDGMDDDMIDAMLSSMPADEQMHVISNKERVNGAASMFYEDVLSDLAERIGSDLYILPSSIHEVLAISVKMSTPEDLAAMVSEVNAQQVAPDEQLSDNVYRFDAKNKTLTLAEDSAREMETEIHRKPRKSR